MSTVDEIQSAIDKLTRLSRIHAGAWRWRADIESNGAVVSDEIEAVAKFATVEDAELSATLHATIDAQIEILRVGADEARYTVSPDEDNEIAIFLTLARAINGREVG